jgi:hypothetical protein
MKSNLMLETVNAQLDRMLNQFARVDSRASVVLSINLGMLTLLALNYPFNTEFQLFHLIGIIPLILISISLTQLYKSQYPNFNGGAQSLFYFKEIAAKTEVNFTNDFTGLTEEQAIKEILCQIWRNSSILNDKFKYLKSSIFWMAISICFWLISLVVYVRISEKFTLGA